MRRKQRVGSGRPRRGATLVFVALFAVALVAMAAFAVDVSRLYVGTNELQTGADAAALRGARYLQNNRLLSPVAVTTDFAKVNAALNDSVRLADADVERISYDPTKTGSARFQLAATWSGANAVQVTASKSTGLLFGRMLSSIVQTPKRKAIAWIANINQVSCPTPWGFPVLSLNKHLYGTATTTVPQTLFADLERKLNETNGRQAMTLIFWPPTHLVNGNKTPKQTGTDSAFYALAQSMNAYASQISSPASCGNASIAVGQSETFPGQGGGAVEQKTVNGVEGKSPADPPGLCATINAPASSADCWPIGTSNFTGQTPGVTVTVGWVGARNGSEAPVLTIGGFRVMCVYRSTPSGKKATGDSCNWLDGNANKAYFEANGVVAPYDEGTIVGYPVTTYPGLGQGTVLGNAPALGQRLILVR